MTSASRLCVALTIESCKRHLVQAIVVSLFSFVVFYFIFCFVFSLHL